MKLWEALKAFDEGKSVQYRNGKRHYWCDLTGDIELFAVHEDREYRIKPKTIRRPKPPEGYAYLLSNNSLVQHIKTGDVAYQLVDYPSALLKFELVRRLLRDDPGAKSLPDEFWGWPTEEVEISDGI